MRTITLKCNACAAQFPEDEAIDGECCPECMSDSLFERVTYSFANELRAQIIEVMT